MSGIFDPAIFDSAIFDTGAVAPVPAVGYIYRGGSPRLGYATVTEENERLGPSVLLQPPARLGRTVI
jgi:hypothetical protein